MVSFGVDADPVPVQMWLQVWRHQFRLASEEEFWKGLSGDQVRYAVLPAPEPVGPLPAYLLRFLRDVRRLSEEEIVALSREEAQELLNSFYSRELEKGT